MLSDASRFDVKIHPSGLANMLCIVGWCAWLSGYIKLNLWLTTQDNVADAMISGLDLDPCPVSHTVGSRHPVYTPLETSMS